MAAIDSNIASVLIAVIGGGFGVWSALVARGNKKDMAPIKQILDNTKTPVETLDGIIKSMQEEMRDRDKRHAMDLKYLDTRLEEALQAFAHCQHERSELTVEVEDLRTILKEHGLTHK